MTKDSTEKIEQQRKLVFGGHPEVQLVAPCKINDGIISFSREEIKLKIKSYENSEHSACFFIPASGSGSRMFQFLFDFLECPNEENRGQVEKFLNHIEDFAFFKQLPLDKRKRLKQYDIDLEDFVSFLLKDHGMNYGDLPKGLIPFHKTDPFILTPFQEHILQGNKVKEDNVKFHFTIQPQHKDLIVNVIRAIQGLTGQDYQVEFSEQEKSTNAYAYGNDGEVFLKENGEKLDRPAGHGALLNNLNSIDSDIIFIKNIDNVQHFEKSEETIDIWKLLGGALLDFREEASVIYKNPTIEGFKKLNEKYQIVARSIINDLNINSIKELLNRPFRVCGMVRNEGQPGGGPFWISDNGVISKQIVEKAQITMKGEQYRLMVQSTHFNPVMISVYTRDFNGDKFDLEQYKDDSKFFVVKKKYRGQDIKFIELPGLWNGSMSNWNTIFVEIPSTTFSPVKTVLDLLDKAHTIK